MRALGRMAEVKNEVTTLGAFMWTVCQEVISHSAPKEINRVCGDGGVLFSSCTEDDPKMV